MQIISSNVRDFGGATKLMTKIIKLAELHNNNYSEYEDDGWSSVMLEFYDKSHWHENNKQFL